MHSIKLALVGALLLGTALASNSSVAFAATTDGNWNVMIVTEKGSCGRAYLSNVNVSNGRVAYQGHAPVNLAGTVTPNGAVRVSIKAGSQGANGTGHLLAAEGHGTWHGHGSAGECTGHWVATR